ncbi:class I SAM-dependent methyltransferase [Halarchaeum nitratireducens]|uniref:S-adenosylmethionine-dependent methyltransferase n=1 Tax=Halarchaeum nitratireducens TaxID=489913 RepID=A0A830GAZ7_9EURY|nr:MULTISPECIES: class I SAM-dependent methyltransferase [Halarchaeum]MBP2252151.1 ubiquinone/menaquinone biosynthesis C-methylase UbiE [Halarchaeum solikamskense]GGN17275.1 S-adenosylmethionine-dependent methyltransferase [Halarchaeum nitratireducens]
MPDPPTPTGDPAPHRVYDRIAAHFSETRAHPWPDVADFVAEREGARGLDLGCGNGRHAELLVEQCETAIGVDASAGLLAEARARAAERGYADALALVRGDARRVPLAAETIDLAVYVATLHHLPSRTARVASLDELARVLAPGGEALVSVWSTTHERFAEDEGFDTTVEWTLPGGDVEGRFYHIYDPAEFRADLDASALGVVDVSESRGNSYAVVTS